MPEDICTDRPLYGGSISSTFPVRFQDVSNIRQVPDHQEAFVDPSRDESLIFELLDLKPDVNDNGSAVWFLQDLANEQDAQGFTLVEQSGVVEVPIGNVSVVVTTAIGQMGISKARQGREAQNVVQVYLANLRLKNVGTDVLVVAYEPVLISPLSESAATVGAGLPAPAAQSGFLPMAEVFKLAVSNFKVNDWNLFDLIYISIFWQGMIAMITGGDSIIGRFVCYHFALEGATVVFIEEVLVMKMQGLFEAHERRKLFYQNDHGVSAGLLDYDSAKSATVSLTRALALKHINEGIGVNAEAPGPLWTPLQPASLPV
ncbi:hypothetical protein NC651_030075 [Populus alba x Populus x berolinensis]|nr:hypothetical protein NC651_030075 [Populus alba x Populus x berolinensis]